MSLKSIRDNYSKLLEALNNSGVKFDASQKSALDGFIMALESTASSQRKQAASMAKQMTEAKLEKEYKKVFESIMKHMQQHYELAGKIQDKITMLKESKNISSKVERYLDLYVESICPKKTVVDYAKMKKLEQINESLRDVLLANDDAVVAKKAKLDESFKKEKGKLETEVAKMQVKLNESMEKSQQLKKKLDQYKALELLESKTKDLPSFEASKIKRHFAEATAPEIEKNFKKVLETVKKDAKDAAKEAETTLESEVKKIVDSEEVDETTEDTNASTSDNAVNEDFETTETIIYNENGDIELGEEDVIDESTMKRWCLQSLEVR